jgi:hypothetical protein
LGVDVDAVLMAGKAILHRGLFFSFGNHKNSGRIAKARAGQRREQ